MESDYITLWTFQDPKVFKMVMESGIAFCDFLGDFASATPEITRAYEWMCEQMKMRVAPPETPKAKYPFWAWRYYNGKNHAKPKREYNNVIPLQEAVFMELRVHISRVLCSDFSLWHHPLSNFNIGIEDTEDQKKIEKSWEYIFDETFLDFDFTFGEPWANRILQATIWCIKKEDVVSADLLQIQTGKKALKVKHIFKSQIMRDRNNLI